MALTYEDMNCDQAGNYDLTANAIVSGVCDYIGLNLSEIETENFLPESYVLHQNYPNPFNPSTRIDYDLPQDGFVKISVLDIIGREVSTILDIEQTAGLKSITWSGTDDQGKMLPSGVYICLLRTNDHASARKMILLR